MSRRKSLTPDEKLTAAYGVLCLGLLQHDVAAMMGCNAGRVAEAVVAARNAFGFQTWAASKADAVEGSEE